jgi:hypothetical protein
MNLAAFDGSIQPSEVMTIPRQWAKLTLMGGALVLYGQVHTVPSTEYGPAGVGQRPLDTS